jgi:hypothetical protein
VYSAYIFMPKHRIMRINGGPPVLGAIGRGVAVVVNFFASVPGAVRAFRAGQLNSRVPATLLIALGGFIPGWTSGLNRPTWSSSPRLTHAALTGLRDLDGWPTGTPSRRIWPSGITTRVENDGLRVIQVVPNTGGSGRDLVPEKWARFQHSLTYSCRRRASTSSLRSLTHRSVTA